MDKQFITDMEAVIDALTFCEETKKKCKKCKKKTECLIFMRNSIAVCLRLLLNQKPVNRILVS